MKPQPPLRPDEWRKLFALRDDLDLEDRFLVRKLIKYAEYLEFRIRRIRGHQTEEENDRW